MIVPLETFSRWMQRRIRTATLTVGTNDPVVVYQWLTSLALRNILKENPRKAFAIIVEPEILSTIVVNSDIQSCRSLAASFNINMAYALNALSVPNAVLYIDAGHGGWLGWDANLKAGANYFASVYKNAGSPSQVRGFAVNTGGWNSW